MTLFSLRRLELQNFRAVRQPVVLDLSHPPGLYFVTGRNEVEPNLGSNGAGKSTIFTEALLWLLRGLLSRSSRPGESVEPWGSEGLVRVCAEFLLGQDIHTLVRQRRPNNLSLNDRNMTQDELDKLLPIPAGVLRRTFLIDQWTQWFLDLRAEEQSQIFSSALNLDLWVQAAARASNKIVDLEKDEAGLLQSLSKMDGAIAEVRQQFDDLSQQEAEWQEQQQQRREKLVLALSVLQQESRSAEKALDQARDQEAVLESLKEQKAQYDALLQQSRDLEATIADVNSRLYRCHAEKAQLQRRAQDYTAKTCPECGQTIHEDWAGQKQHEIAQQVFRLAAEEEWCRQTLQGCLNSQQQLDTMHKNLHKALADWEAQQNRISECVNRTQLAWHQFHAHQQALAELDQQQNPYSAQCDLLEQRFRALCQERKGLVQGQKELLAEIARHRFWQQGFREIRLEQIDLALTELEIAANRHAEELGLSGWEIQFAIERETKSGTLSTGFNAFLYPPGQKSPIPFHSYSGGESHRWQLATTFALSEVLLARVGMEPDFEIWDEPTTHLSAQGMDDLLQCLRERALRLDRRIYVIDHHLLASSAFDGIITVVRTQQGVQIQ